MSAEASTAPASQTAAAREPRLRTSRAGRLELRPPSPARHRMTAGTASPIRHQTPPAQPQVLPGPEAKPEGKDSKRRGRAWSIPNHPWKTEAASAGKQRQGTSRKRWQGWSWKQPWGASVTPEGWGQDRERWQRSYPRCPLAAGHGLSPPASDGPTAPVWPLSSVQKPARRGNGEEEWPWAALPSRLPWDGRCRPVPCPLPGRPSPSRRHRASEHGQRAELTARTAPSPAQHPHPRLWPC